MSAMIMTRDEQRILKMTERKVIKELKIWADGMVAGVKRCYKQELNLLESLSNKSSLGSWST